MTELQCENCVHDATYPNPCFDCKDKSLFRRKCPECGCEMNENGRYADDDEGGGWEGFGEWTCKCGHEEKVKQDDHSEPV